jgi:hypothetical protein
VRRDLEQKLRKLESRFPQQPTQLDKEFECFVWFRKLAVAYYCGDPGPEDSIAEAYQRALGYPNSYEFREALVAIDSDFGERATAAEDRLLKKFGVSWKSKISELLEAFKRMEAGFSEFYNGQYSSHCQKLLGNDFDLAKSMLFA